MVTKRSLNLPLYLKESVFPVERLLLDLLEAASVLLTHALTVLLKLGEAHLSLFLSV